MDSAALGSQLRSRRAAAGRTVASVAADAGLSVPYIANLENGRGNPTMTALARLAGALGMRLTVTLAPARETGEAGEAGEAGHEGQTGEPGRPAVPPSLVRFGRSARFRRSAKSIAAALAPDAPDAPDDLDEMAAAELPGRLVTALAAVGEVMGRDLGEADWSRILDALLLVAAHPADSQTS